MSVDYVTNAYLCAATVWPATVDIFELKDGEVIRHMGTFRSSSRRRAELFEKDCKAIIDALTKTRPKAGDPV